MTTQEKISKLKKLGVWYKWRKNIIEKHGKRFAIFKLEEDKRDFRGLIIGSFHWDDTPEGYNFWDEISKK